MKTKSILIFISAIVLISFSTWSTISWIKNRKPNDWSDKQVELMIDKCINSSKYLSSADSTIGNEICGCAIEKLFEEYGYEEIWELNKQNKEYLMELFTPIIIDCLFPTLYEKNHTVINDRAQLKWISDSINSFWIPTDTELRLAESILDLAIAETSNSYWTILSTKTTKKYYRQYSFYIDQNGDKIIYINAFCRQFERPVDSSGVWIMKPYDWKNEFLIVEDGGDCFWSIQINLTTMSYFDFYVNGVA